MPSSSKIFLPHRALGYVSNHIPLIVRYIHKRRENIIVTCVGKSFHSYGSTHLKLLAVSDLHEDDITCLAGDTYHVYTASLNNIYAWRRGTELKHTYSGHKRPVHLLSPFGPHLISVDESSAVNVWDIKTEELHLELSFDNDIFQITACCHPSTYLNKVLFGSQQGSMQLWNLKTSKLIYSFSGWSSSITVLEQAPAIDVVAIGLVSGKIILHNLKFDETVVEFTQDWGPVTSLSFRSDGEPIMASGSMVGHVVFWNLEERKVSSQLICGHDAAIAGLHCFPNEPLMVTSSPDNSVKIWIFDLPDGGVRLLRLREGHASPPSFIRFHGGNGQNILSAGGDSSLRIFNTVSETANKSLGKASYNPKLAKKKGKQDAVRLQMPPIVQFTSETTREKEWDSIAAIHLGLPVVTTWSFHKQKMGELKLYPSNLKGENVKHHLIASSLYLTHCGNFVVIGYSSGNIERFNIQSGIHRCSYGIPQAHKGPVRGVAVDSLNQIVISGGRDGYVKFWYFKGTNKPPLNVLNVEESVNFFQTHRESSLLCVSLEDFSLSIVDLDTKTVVRRFSGHTGQVTDATFSPDSRWIISASMDCTIRTWDIPSAQLVDCFQVDAACTSLTMSPTGEFLATSHVDYKSVFLWSNKTLFSLVSLKPLSADKYVFPMVSLPSSGTVQQQVSEEEVESDEELAENSPEQIENMVTLSTLALSRWQNLLDIDLVKKRNKPLAAPKTPKAAPFFLPTLPSLNLEFDLSSVLESENGSKTIKLQNVKRNLTPFAKLLMDSSDFQPVINKLKLLGPSAIDFEVNTLAMEGEDCESLLLKFMEMLNHLLRTNRDFELGQAYLALFLKVHGTTVATTPVLYAYMDQLHEAQASSWKILQEKIWYTLAAVNLLKES